jgi:hypothetical protein
MIEDNPTSYLISELQRFKEEVRYDQLYQDYHTELVERGIFTTN